MISNTEKQLRDALGLLIEGEGRKNYSVKAGAGGGKTTKLSQRICNQIVDGVPTDAFVIITYTNAAAAELRDKITHALREKMEVRENLSEEQLEHVKKALASMDLMQISTIHAFLLKILREHTFEAGITLDAKLLEEEKNQERKVKFFDAWYKSHMEEIDAIGQSDDWIHTAKNGNRKEHRREVFGNMFLELADVRENVYCPVKSKEEIDGELIKEAGDYVTAWKQKLLNYEVEFGQNRVKKKDGTLKNVNKDPQSVLDCISRIKGKTIYTVEDACSVSDALGTIRKMMENDYNFYGTAGGQTIPIGSLRSVLDTFDLGSNMCKWNFRMHYEYALNAGKAALAVAYVCRMQQAYQKEIDANTLELSNNDILYRADRLLKQHPDVLDELRGRYSKIYVDEFQDTTGLQADIILRLSERMGTRFEDYDLEDDKLLVVGDPKQSIYRFTGAEKAVYDRIDQTLDAMSDEKAQSVALRWNFRSNKAIVDWVNDSYQKLMGAAYEPMETDWIVQNKQALHGVFQYVPVLPEGVEKYKGEQDADAVRKLIEELVGKPYCFLEECHRKSDGTFGEPEIREIQYSDIMVLFRNTSNMSGYASVLEQAGIPVSLQGKQKISGEEVLQNFVIWMEYLAAWSKKKELAALQVLLGLDVTNTEPERLEQEVGKLRKLKDSIRKGKTESAAVAQYLLAHPELYMPKDKEQRREQVKGYQMRLHQMVETCVVKNDGDLRQLAEYMRAYLEKDVEREVPLEHQENAVRLMNVHKAKGLTGKIVVIADRSNAEGCRYGAFRAAGCYYPVAAYKHTEYKKGKYVAVPVYGYDRELMAQAWEEETEEAIRLQYVAATRAAHALILMPALGNNVWFSDPAYEYDKLPDIQTWLMDRKNDAAGESNVRTKEQQSIRSQTYAALLDRCRENDSADPEKLSERPVCTGITPSGLETGGSTGYVSGEEGYVGEERPKGDVFGDVMHRVYELLVMRFKRISQLAEAEMETAVEQAINQAIIEYTESMRQKDRPEAFLAFLKHIFLEQGYVKQVLAPILSNAEAVYPEYAFSFYVPEGEMEAFKREFASYFTAAKLEYVADKIWVNGKADLVVKQKDGTIKVYDYKSDSRNGKPLADFEAAIAKKYEGQLALYRYAIGKAFGVSQVETEIIHLYRN